MDSGLEPTFYHCALRVEVNLSLRDRLFSVYDIPIDYILNHLKKNEHLHFSEKN